MPQASWNRDLGRVRWIANIGPYQLSVVPCNAVFLEAPNPYRGLCQVTVAVTGAVVWQLEFKGACIDLTELMVRTELAFGNHLLSLADTCAWPDVQEPLPFEPIELQDEGEVLQSLWPSADTQKYPDDLLRSVPWVPDQKFQTCTHYTFLVTDDDKPLP